MRRRVLITYPCYNLQTRKLKETTHQVAVTARTSRRDESGIVHDQIGTSGCSEIAVEP
jgi:hypothetical protein